MTKNAGTSTTARQVDEIMPVKMLSLSERRALAPAPVAITNGTTPRMWAKMKALEDIGIGRKQVRAALIVPSMIGLPRNSRDTRATPAVNAKNETLDIQSRV